MQYVSTCHTFMSHGTVLHHTLTHAYVCGLWMQEFAERGDLFEALKRAPHMMFSEQVAVVSYLAPFLNAVAYLHCQVSITTKLLR